MREDYTAISWEVEVAEGTSGRMSMGFGRTECDTWNLCNKRDFRNLLDRIFIAR